MLCFFLDCELQIRNTNSHKRTHGELWCSRLNLRLRSIRLLSIDTVSNSLLACFASGRHYAYLQTHKTHTHTHRAHKASLLRSMTGLLLLLCNTGPLLQLRTVRPIRTIMDHPAAHLRGCARARARARVRAFTRSTVLVLRVLFSCL